MGAEPSIEEMLADWVASVRDDPLAFVMGAFQWGKGDLEGFDGPDTWQRETLEAIGRAVRGNNFDGSTPVPAVRMATSSGHGVGKSALTAWVILWIISTRPHSKGVVTANTSAQLETKTWAELARWKKRCITGGLFDLSMGKMSMKIAHKAHPETWRCDALTCREENSEAFAGLHAAGSSPYYLFDEASAVPDIIWDVAEGGMTDGEPFFLVFGNPTRNTGRFRECFGKYRHRWITQQIDSRTAKLPNKEQIAQWVHDYGEDSDFVRVRVRGVFPRAGSMQFIPSDLVDRAANPDNDVPTTLMDPLVFGVDVARFGDDSTVIAIRRGRDARSIPWVVMRGADTMQVAARIVDLATQYRPDAIFVDGGGVGGGVVDRLRYLAQPVHEIQFGAAADRAMTMQDGRIVYANKRAEMWGSMRDWLAGGIIPPTPELISDLPAVEYGYVFKDGKDAIQLEKKEEMKRRGLQSPDYADALCFLGNTKVRTPKGLVDIKDLKLGDEVVTPFRTARVEAIWISQTERLTTATFTNGATLVGKPDHKIFVWDKGSVPLGDLASSSEVEPFSVWRLALWRLSSLLNTKARNTGFKKLVDTTVLDAPFTAKGFSIAAFGLRPMELFRRGSTSTTKTVIGQTLFLRTLSWLSGGLTAVSICGGGSSATLTRTTPIWSKRDAPLLRGTALLMASIGTKSMAATLGPDASQSWRSVKNAETNSRHISAAEPNIAPSRARSPFSSQHILRIADRALGAAKGFWQTVIDRRPVVPARVQTENVPPTTVYNLTLDRDNAFYANDILVFNCLTFAYPVAPHDRTYQERLGRRGSTHQIEYDPFGHAWGST